MAGLCGSERYLPPELLADIWRHLPWHLSRLNFRAVCREWRHLPSPPPLLCFDSDKFQSLANGELPHRRFAPADTAERCCGCYDDWLLRCNWFGNADRSPTCSLSNPLSRATIAGIPLYRDDTYGLLNFPMTKVIVCSPDLVVALLFGGSVALYRPGAASWSVSPSDEARRRDIRDITLYHGKIYALESNDDIFVHELGGGDAGATIAKHMIMAKPPETRSEVDPRWTRHYLVVCRGHLLMVRWNVPCGRIANLFEGVKLRVFEADLEEGQWLEVDDLGDHALFIGRGCSKAIRFTGDNQRFQGNRIYFLGYDFRANCYLLYGESPTYGFYDLRSHKITQIFLTDKWNVRPQHMEWFFP